VGNIDPIAESCNGLDDDCDGNIDNGVLITYYQDSDSDSYGNASATTDACSQPTGYVSDNTDCDDSDADKNPGEIEVCDGKDNDCDGSVDEGFNNESCSYTCIDEGYNWTSSNVCCGNDAGEANPYQTNETACDSNDNDCDGSVDEGCQCSPPGILQECGTNVGECSTGNQTCLGNYTWGICENETAPVTEDCNDTLDNDCDGFADANDSNCWICGNGIVDQNEECEFDENCTGSQYCSNCDCKSTGGGGGGGHTVTTGTGTSVCGNGIINTGELCDKEVGCAYGYECSINCLQCIKTGTNETVVEIEEEETYYFSGCSYTVLESNGNYVYLEINCEGRKQQLTLTTEQGLEIDSDGDGSVDTYITLHGFTNDRADIGFRSIEKVSYRPPFTLTTEAMALVFLLIMGGILALFYFASKGFFGNAGAKKKKK